MRRRPVVLVLFAAVLAALAAGATAFVSYDKTVTVAVDGQVRQVHTFADTVRGVLDRAGVDVGGHDVVAPDLAAPVSDGSRVIVRRGRPIQLTVNGHQRTVWVTADSVDEALGQLGLDTHGEWLSASRSRRIPVSGIALKMRTPQRVQILVDGKRISRETTAPTVRDLLHAAGVHVDSDDKVSTPLTMYPTTGLTVRVTRVDKKTVRREVPIPFSTQTRQDGSLYKGQTKVLQAGANGTRLEVTINVYHDHKVVYRKRTVEKVTTPPTPKIVAVGTKARPAPAPAPASTGHSPSADGLNWAALAQCESGGNPRAVSPGGAYRGLYQFDLGTWHAMGGAGDPINASPGEQTYRAQILFRQRGTSPWPVCGHNLYS